MKNKPQTHGYSVKKIAKITTLETGWCNCFLLFTFMNMKYRNKFKSVKMETNQTEIHSEKLKESVMREPWEVMGPLWSGLQWFWHSAVIYKRIACLHNYKWWISQDVNESTQKVVKSSKCKIFHGILQKLGKFHVTLSSFLWVSISKNQQIA